MSSVWRILAVCLDMDVGRGLLESAPETCEVVTATSVEEGAGRFDGAGPHASVVCGDVPRGARLATVTELRQRWPDQAIVAVSSTPTDSGALEALRAGADDIVDTEMDAAELLRRVATLCALRQGAAAAVRRAEVRLREAEARYRALVESAQWGVALLQGGRLAYINPAGAAMYGAATDDLVGKSAGELLDLVNLVSYEEVYERLLSGGSEDRGELVVPRPDGSPLPVTYEAVGTDLEGEPAILVTFNDVSDRHALQEESERRRRELELMHALAVDLGSSPDPELVVSTGCQRIAEAAGLDACALYLVDPEEKVLRLAGRPALAEGIPPMPEEMPGLHELPSEPLVINFDGDPPSGARVADEGCAAAHQAAGFGGCMLVPLRAGNASLGVLKGARVPGRAMTAADLQLVVAAATSVGLALENARLYANLKESYGRIVDTQVELVRAERLAALGELSATVAHEVRNPLAAIYNSLSQLKRLAPEGDATTLVDIAQEEATRLNRIIGDLLQFARPGEPDLRPTPMDDVIDAAVRAAAQDAAAREEVRVEVAPMSREILALGDGSRLRQALLNLIINAFQAIEGPGTVRLDARKLDGEPWVEVSVEDDGPGMPAEVLARAFDPFYTTRPAGSGLGLAIVKRIVEDQRGTVKIDTEPGDFTRFRILLPVVSGEKGEKSTPST